MAIHTAFIGRDAEGEIGLEFGELRDFSVQDAIPRDQASLRATPHRRRKGRCRKCRAAWPCASMIAGIDIDEHGRDHAGRPVLPTISPSDRGRLDMISAGLLEDSGLRVVRDGHRIIGLQPSPAATRWADSGFPDDPWPGEN